MKPLKQGLEQAVSLLLVVMLSAMVVLTFTDDLARRNGTLDVAAFTRALGVPVVAEDMARIEALCPGRRHQGVVLRAIADDYMASWSVGISVERGVALSWALSSMVATVAGVLWGSVQGVDQSLALLLLKGITVAVLGGMDSLGGAILAGLFLGAFESIASGLLDPLLGGGSRDLVIAVVLIMTIMVRPHGLFGRHDIERL